ncbi:MAG: L-type lectin-domain containing protein [Verrucomicrobiota bacterium]
MKSYAVVLLALVSGIALNATGQVLFDHLGTASHKLAPAPRLVLNGDAVQMDRVMRLTPSLRIQAGSAWLADKQDVKNGFSTMFQFQVTDRGSSFPKAVTTDVGADGFAFVIQNSDVDALGSAGGGIGYSGIPNSLVVEFDTWDNNESGQALIRDPDDNHVSVQTHGTETNYEFKAYSLGLTPNLPELSDGDVHTAKLEYIPGTLLVYVDDMDLPVLAVKADLESLLSLDEGKAWVGFTAATWNAFENHDILNWVFTGAKP